MTRTRRSRYVFTLRDKHGRETTVQDLAHDPSAYKPAGYEVIGARKYKRGEDFTPPAGAGWTLHQTNLRIAYFSLGLSWPVAIKQIGHKGESTGIYHAIADDLSPMHKIVVKRWLTPKVAGQTLWHELTHASQAERCARDCAALPGTDTFLDAWNNLYLDGNGHAEKPMEIEAFAAEERNNHLPLARRKR